MKYEPEYAKGEIIVFFKDNEEGVGEDFASTFGSYIGFELKEAWERGDGAYVYSCTEGKEEEAIENFKKFATFVGGAERRDLKLERRWGEAEEVIGMAESLRDGCDNLLKDEYNNRLKEISDYLNEIMEK